VNAPTAFVDLNGVLDRLVDEAASALGSDFVGAHLQGSFALGEGDEHSDVDFVVVTTRHPTREQQAALQLLHGLIHDLPVAWAQHLEGSYIPRDLLRRVDPARTPCFYLDNGARTLVWSDHCNSAHVRWLLREHGVVLAGPEPHELVDPVSEDVLRGEASRALHEYAAWAEESRARYDAGEGLETWSELPFSRWQQPYLVLTFCRLLWTVRHGAVTTKREAAEWALRELDPQWSALIAQALADRADPWQRTQLPSPPEAVERTCAFIDYVLASRR
jgi:hypothetical protein